MHEQNLFDGPYRSPEFLRASPPLPARGLRNKGVETLKIGLLLATGLANSAALYLDSSSGSERIDYVRMHDGVLQQVNSSAQLAEERLAVAWGGYLRDLSEHIPAVVARKVRRFWFDLARHGRFPPPRAAPINDESFIMSWDQGQRHIEVEIFAKGHLEWFYCDRGVDSYEGSEGSSRQAVVAVSDYLDRLRAS